MSVLIHIKMIIALSLAGKWAPLLITENWDQQEPDPKPEKWLSLAEQIEWYGDWQQAGGKALKGEKLRGLPRVKYDDKGHYFEVKSKDSIHRMGPGVYFYTGVYEVTYSLGENDAEAGPLSGTFSPIKLSPQILELMGQNEQVAK